jgi:hypothetical protein
MAATGHDQLDAGETTKLPRLAKVLENTAGSRGFRKRPAVGGLNVAVKRSSVPNDTAPQSAFFRRTAITAVDAVSGFNPRRV